MKNKNVQYVYMYIYMYICACLMFTYYFFTLHETVCSIKNSRSRDKKKDISVKRKLYMLIYFKHDIASPATLENSFCLLIVILLDVLLLDELLL